MKTPCLFLLIVWLLAPARAGIRPAEIDLNQVRDAASLQITVLEDWKPAPRDASVRQKLIEITVCDWWPGQPVRIPVTLNAPATSEACRHLIVANMGLAPRAVLPTGAMLQLLKEDGVGVVLVGMGPIEAMKPVGQLHLGMKENLLATKDARFTPAWIWGMSYMRALTAGLMERNVLRPGKVLATGGSKCGVAAMGAVIHDDRFTAAMPVVTPISKNPGGPYVIGTEPEELARINASFVHDLAAGRISDLPASCLAALEERRERQGNERITRTQARGAGWTDTEIAEMNDSAWDFGRVTRHYSALRRRGLELLFNVGTNDNVSADLPDAGRRLPTLPIFIVPGGQHGGPTTTGFTRQVPRLAEVDANLLVFARAHFLGERIAAAQPEVQTFWDRETRRLRVTVRFQEGKTPAKNELWWSFDRHPPGTLPYEYDRWQSAELRPAESAVLSGEIVAPDGARTLQLVTTHGQASNGLTLHFSSLAQDIQLR